MNINDKFNKLTDLLIEWSESGMFLSDLNYRIKGNRNEEDLVSDCCGAELDDFGRIDENGMLANVCSKCHLACDFHWGLVGKPKTAKTEEIKLDVTTSEEKEEKILKFKDMPNWNKLADKFNKPIPWLPNPGDGYYTIHLAFNEPAKFYWTSPVPTLGEMALLKLGLIFKTREEAMAKINSLLNL